MARKRPHLAPFHRAASRLPGLRILPAISAAAEKPATPGTQASPCPEDDENRLATNRKEGEPTNHWLFTVVLMKMGIMQTQSAVKFQFDFAKSSPLAYHLGEAAYPDYVLILKPTSDGSLLVPSAITMISN